MSRLDAALEALDRGKKGFVRTFGEGREDHREALKRGFEEKGLETDANKWDQMMGSNRSVTMMAELLGKADPEMVKQRKAMGLGMSDDRATRAGEILGTLAGDVVQDRGRGIWWLLNAPQATANVINEMALKKYAPDLYKAEIKRDEKGNPVTRKNPRAAQRLGVIDSQGRMRAGYSSRHGQYMERKYAPGLVEALSIPAGIAVNTSIGLMNPFGGQEGYKAVFESEEDPSKSDNVLGEIAAKYVLGRTGGLLPWDEFKQVRPDVSKDEYMRYKAFKFDNEGDLNPLDGDVVIPTGVLKYTDEGIHGPEVQFLGRSLPLATGILPTAAAIAGTAAGAGGHIPKLRGGIRGGMVGGLGSLAVSSILGNAIESERRRRNADENSIGLN